MLKHLLSRSRPTAARRNLMRQELIEALQAPVCALCHLARQKNPRYVETWLDGAVYDVDQRDAWRAMKGFCNWHAWMAIDTPQSASSLAILYDDVLSYEIRRLAALKSDPGVSRRWHWRPGRRLAGRVQQWLHSWYNARQCPACRLWHDQERLCMTVLLDDWHDPALTTAFARSIGLCLPHLALLINQDTRHPHLPALIAAQQECLQRLQTDLQEFIRKQDYRFAHEPYGSEADAWQRVVALFVGLRGWRHWPPSR